MSTGNNVNIMIVDPTGDCAVVETLNADGLSTKAVRRGEGYLYSLNHYDSKEHTDMFPNRRYFSDIRAKRIDEFFRINSMVTEKGLKQLLTDMIPNGLCCHAYSDWFGTLRSMFFDVSESRLSICLGSPQTGTWFDADLNAEPELSVQEVEYFDERMPDYFWNEV